MPGRGIQGHAGFRLSAHLVDEHGLAVSDAMRETADAMLAGGEARVEVEVDWPNERIGLSGEAPQ